eukprot:12417182-Alexandrium_andersonii.AAC.1
MPCPTPTCPDERCPPSRAAPVPVLTRARFLRTRDTRATSQTCQTQVPKVSEESGPAAEPDTQSASSGST